MLAGVERALLLNFMIRANLWATLGTGGTATLFPKRLAGEGATGAGGLPSCRGAWRLGVTRQTVEEVSVRDSH